MQDSSHRALKHDMIQELSALITPQMYYTRVYVNFIPLALFRSFKTHQHQKNNFMMQQMKLEQQ